MMSGLRRERVKLWRYAQGFGLLSVACACLIVGLGDPRRCSAYCSEMSSDLFCRSLWKVRFLPHSLEKMEVRYYDNDSISIRM